MKRLTLQEESDLEIASLRRQIRDFQQEIDELRTKYEDLEAEKASRGALPEILKDKDEIIARLSNDIANQKWEIDSNREHNVKLKELFRRHHEELLAADERHQWEVVSARNAADTGPSSLPLNAPRMTDTRERAKPPQPQQSSSATLAKQLVSGNASNNTTEEGFEAVKTIKDKVAHGTGAKATFLGRSLTDGTLLQSLDTDEHEKKKKVLKVAKIPDNALTAKRYVVPSPDTLRSNEQSRAGFRASAPSFISSSSPGMCLSTLTGTDGQGLGDHHGLKHVHSKGYTCEL